MAPELGIFSLILAFVLSLSQAFFGLVGAWKGKPVWMAVARPAVTGQFVFVAMAFACLVYCFVHNDFSVLYVAHNSNSQLPLFYRVAALWGAHEGSLLLWILILSTWSVAVAAFSRALPLSFSSRVLGVMGLISSGFMLFTLWTSSPLGELVPQGPPPEEGPRRALRFSPKERSSPLHRHFLTLPQGFGTLHLLPLKPPRAWP